MDERIEIGTNPIIENDPVEMDIKVFLNSVRVAASSSDKKIVLEALTEGNEIVQTFVFKKGIYLFISEK